MTRVDWEWLGGKERAGRERKTRIAHFPEVRQVHLDFLGVKLGDGLCNGCSLEVQALVRISGNLEKLCFTNFSKRSFCMKWKSGRIPYQMEELDALIWYGEYLSTLTAPGIILQFLEKIPCVKVSDPRNGQN